MKIQKKPSNKTPLPDGYYRCEACKGTGKIWKGFFRKKEICFNCKGKGYFSYIFS